ncbi:MAG TPA: hypothetical protein EYP49_16190 [Anaerolineae bacterium]|nr:hypothetical protein [Anaerolineae bacterium]
MYNRHLPLEARSGKDAVQETRARNARQWLREHLITIVLAALLILVSILTARDGWQRLAGGLEQPYHTALSPQLAGSRTVGQTFICPCVELNSIAVLPRFGDSPPANLTLHLRTLSDAGHDLRRATVQTADLRSDEYTDFGFVPIANSAGTKFYFYVESTDQEKAETGNDKAATRLLRTTNDVYAWGEMYVDDGPATGDLAFKVSCSPSMPGVATNILRRITDNKPLLWGNVTFYAMLAALYLGLMITLWLKLRALFITEERA